MTGPRIAAAIEESVRATFRLVDLARPLADQVDVDAFLGALARCAAQSVVAVQPLDDGYPGR